VVLVTSADLVFLDVDVRGKRCDVALGGGRVVSVDDAGARSWSAHTRVRGEGRALLPGLHDHHVHVMALDAWRRSVDLERQPPRGLAALQEQLRERAAVVEPGGFLRVVGYDESMAGDLDRHGLDAMSLPCPVRVQHRTGALWIVCSATLELLPRALPEGAEIDEGQPNGRFHRADAWLGRHWPRHVVDLAEVGQLFVRRGVTGVSDMTPWSRLDDLDVLTAGVRTGSFSPRLVVTGGPSLTSASFDPLIGVGPVKIIVDEAEPPPFDDLIRWIAVAHGAGRPVAIHCIGRVVLALCVAALAEAGSHPGDRLEHGSVVPPEFHEALVRLGCTVVTQPGFIRSRGDRYLRDVDPSDREYLWPCGSLIGAGVRVAFGTDAPYGPVDPWQAMAAACDRSTASGVVLGGVEAVSPAEALDRFLAPLDRPGAPARRLHVGVAADLCLLDRPLAAALTDLDAVGVSGTWIGGVPVFAA
jgi:predicted amidohydrolase YtcJ